MIPFFYGENGHARYLRHPFSVDVNSSKSPTNSEEGPREKGFVLFSRRCDVIHVHIRFRRMNASSQARQSVHIRIHPTKCTSGGDVLLTHQNAFILLNICCLPKETCPQPE